MVSLVSLLGLFLYHVSTFSWPFLPHQVHIFNATSQSPVISPSISER